MSSRPVSIPRRLDRTLTIRQLLKSDWMLLPTLLAVFVVVLILSLLRFNAYNTGMFDLGNMSQAIWSATQGRPLEFTHTAGNISRLSLHVELFYFLLVPIYAVWSSPESLLTIQAVLFTSGAWPLYQLAKRKLNSPGAGLAFAGIYLLYPVAQTAVLFDFHGDTLAMPLLLFSIEALDRRAWPAFVFWTALALSCKFYVAVPVVALGLVLWIQGERRAGFFTALGAAAWGGFAFFVIRPYFAPPYELGQGIAVSENYLAFYFGQWQVGLLPTLLPRIVSGLIVFTPAIWLGLRAPGWLLPAAAVSLPALLSTGPGSSFDYRYHHYALAVPFLMAAMVHGAHKIFRKQTPTLNFLGGWQFWVLASLLFTLMAHSIFVDTPLNTGFWKPSPGRGLDGMQYGRSSRDRMKDGWLRENIPPGSPLASSLFLATHLTNRESLFMVHRLPDNSESIEYAVPDALFDYRIDQASEEILGGVFHDLEAVRFLLQNPSFGLVEARDGLLLFQRDAAPEAILLHKIQALIPVGARGIQEKFGESIGLVSATVENLGGRRFRFSYEWIPLRPLGTDAPFFAITRLEGVEDARIVHLPTQALHQTPKWEAGQVVEEAFDVVLLADIPAGEYLVYVGWYDSSHFYAAETDERSRLGLEVQVSVLQLD